MGTHLCESVFRAGFRGHSYCIRTFIDRGISVNENNSFWTPPLHFATENVDCVLILLEHGATKCNINEVDTLGNTALHQACTHGYVDTVALLLDYGAMKCNINVQNRDGYTPLHRAVNNGHFTTVIELLKHQVNAYIKNFNGSTPLHNAVSNNYFDIVKVLIEYSDPTLKNKEGKTPLDLAKTEEMRTFIQNYLDGPEVKEPEFN